MLDSLNLGAEWRRLCKRFTRPHKTQETKIKLLAHMDRGPCLTSDGHMHADILCGVDVRHESEDLTIFPVNPPGDLGC